jgi:hypothetical protein
MNKKWRAVILSVVLLGLSPTAEANGDDRVAFQRILKGRS